MSMKLIWNKDKCTGCRVCEAICALTKEGEFNPVKSRGRIGRTIQDNYLYKVRIHCLQCAEPACMGVCPAGAIACDENGTKTVDEDKCLGCRMCEMACPVGAITVCSEKGVAQKCDLCRDRETPECAKFCYAQALKYLPEERIGISMARAKSDTFLNAMGKEI